MPFTRKTESQLMAFSDSQLDAYLAVIERLFTLTRRNYGRLRYTGPVPQDWRDYVEEINAVKAWMVKKALLDSIIDSLLPDCGDPCASPN
jgi:hypothetical protein